MDGDVSDRCGCLLKYKVHLGYCFRRVRGEFLPWKSLVTMGISLVINIGIWSLSLSDSLIAIDAAVPHVGQALMSMQGTVHTSQDWLMYWNASDSKNIPRS